MVWYLKKKKKDKDKIRELEMKDMEHDRFEITERKYELLNYSIFKFHKMLQNEKKKKLKLYSNAI